MFIAEPPASAERDAAYDEDRQSDGYVANLTRLWTWRPDVLDGFTALRQQLQDTWELDDLDRAVLVVATARARADSYCSLAWGSRLAELVGEHRAAETIRGRPEALAPRQRTLAHWAHTVVSDPNATTPDQVAALRECGLSDRAVFEATLFIALRLAFSTVNDALGAAPDHQLAQAAPAAVRDAVTYGRTPTGTS